MLSTFMYTYTFLLRLLHGGTLNTVFLLKVQHENNIVLALPNF